MVIVNEGIISTASFCCQVAALVQNHKIANNSATTEAREKNKQSTYLESLEFSKNFDERLSKFENYQILLNNINHKFLVPTKLFIGWKSLIGQTDRMFQPNDVTITVTNYHYCYHFVTNDPYR